jgi:hypothetical protein
MGIASESYHHLDYWYHHLDYWVDFNANDQKQPKAASHSNNLNLNDQGVSNSSLNSQDFRGKFPGDRDFF